MTNVFGESSKILSLFLAWLMVFSVFAGPASAAIPAGSGGGTSAALTTAGVAPSVNQNDTIDAGGNISMWPQSILTLRSPRDSFTGAYTSPAASTAFNSMRVGITMNGTGTSLGKDRMAFFNRGQEVRLVWDGDTVGYPNVINGERVQLVAVHMDRGATPPSSLSGFSKLFEGGQNTSARIVGNKTGSSHQTKFTFYPKHSGQYFMVLAYVNDPTNGTGFVGATNDLGSVTASSNVTIVGIDNLPVQESRTSVSAPPSAGAGKNVSFDVDTSGVYGSQNVSHTLLLYDENAISQQNETIYVKGSSIDRIESTLKYVNGSNDVQNGSQVFGVDLGKAKYRGSKDVTSLLERVLGSSSNVQSVSPNATVNASLTARVGSPVDTVSVRTGKDWPHKEYRWLYVATAQNGTETVSDTGTLNLTTSVQLNLTANETTVHPGDTVGFRVTREDTGAGTSATVTVDGKTLQTDSSGRLNYTFASAGTFHATASKQQTTVPFLNDSVDVSVLAPANLVVEKASATKSQVYVGQAVKVLATVNNTGDETGSRNVTLTVDGTPTITKNVTVDPGTPTNVTFSPQFNATGTYDLAVDNVSAGSVTVKQGAAVTGFTLNRTAVTVGGAVTVNATVNNTASTSQTITVRVYHNGTDVANRSVTVGAKGTTTETFRPIPPGGFAVFGNHTISVDSQPAKTVRVNRHLHNLTLTSNRTNGTLVEGQQIGFYVIDNATNNPVQGATVTADGQSKTTDASGSATFTLSNPGTVTATATKPANATDGYRSNALDVTVLKKADVSVTGASIVGASGGTKRIPAGGNATVGATVRNTGNLSKSGFAVTLTENGSTVLDSTSVTVPGNANVTVSFTHQFPTVGNRTLEANGVGAGRLEVFSGTRVTNFSVSPRTVFHGDTVTVDAAVRNTVKRDRTGFSVKVIVNGTNVVARRNVTVPAQSVKNVTFSGVPAGGFATIGTKNVTVNDVRPAQGVQVKRRPVQLNVTTNRTKTHQDVPGSFSKPVAIQGEDVRFTVTRNDTGSPVQGATVAVGNQTLTTDANGTVVTNVSQPGNYTVQVAKPQNATERYFGDTLPVRILQKAEVQYSSLLVTPRQVLTNETVWVNATVTNVGEVNTTATVPLVIGGSTVDTQSVHLTPGQQTRVSFARNFSMPGTRSVTIDSLTTQSVIVRGPPDFVIQNVGVRPPSMKRGSITVVTATVTNQGGVSGAFNATYEARDHDNGDRVLETRNRSVVIDSGQTKTIAFSRAMLKTGNFTFAVNNRTAVANATTNDTVVEVETLDAVPPAVTLERPVGRRTTYGSTMVLNVTDANSSVASVKATLGGVTKVDATSLSTSTKTFNFTADGVPEGPRTLTVTATDGQGNTVVRNFTVDLVSAPSVTSVSPTGVAGRTPTVDATFTDNRHGSYESGVDPSKTALYVNGNRTDLSRTLVNTSGHLRVLLNRTVLNGTSLVNGSNTVRLEVTDRAGHTTARRFTFVRDAVAPRISLSTKRAYLFGQYLDVSTNAKLQVSATSNDPHPGTTKLLVYRNRSGSRGELVYSQTLSGTGSGSTQRTTWDARYDNGTPVSNDNYDVVLNSTDALGNTNETVVTPIPVDNVPPVVTLNNVTANGQTVSASSTKTVYTNGKNLWLNASVDEPTHLTLSLVGPQGYSKSQSAKQSSSPVTLHPDVSGHTEGTYTFAGTAVDDGGNINTSSSGLKIKLDHTAPNVGSSLDLNNSTGYLTVSVTSDEPLSGAPTVELQFPKSSNQTLTPSKVGPTSYRTTVTAGANGQYNMTATGVDRAGNVGTSTSTATVTSQSIQSGKNQTITLFTAKKKAFVQIHTKNTSLPPNVLTSLSNSRAPLSVFVSTAAARQFIAANTNLNESQVGFVNYGFTDKLVAPFLRNDPRITITVFHVTPTGPEPLETHHMSQPVVQNVFNFTATSGYFVGNRTGLSSYVLGVKDAGSPNVTFATDPARPTGDVYNATQKYVNVTANVSDATSVNESNVTVTFYNGTANTTVTNEANVTETSSNTTDVQYNATGLEPNTTYRLYVTATDDSDNSVTQVFEFRTAADPKAPTTTLKTPTDGASLPPGTTSQFLNVTYVDEPQGSPNATGIDTGAVSMRYDGTNVTSSANVTAGYVSYTASGLKPGSSHEVNVSVADNAGNVTWENFTFGVRNDTFAPNVTLTNASRDPIKVGKDGTAHANVTANVTDGDLGVKSTQVYFDGLDDTAKATIADRGGVTNVTYNATGLEAGKTYNLTILAVDEAGNRNRTTVNLSVLPDNFKPNITSVTPAQGATLNSTNSTVNLSVSYADGMSGVDTNTVSLSVNGNSQTKNATIRPHGANVTVSGFDPGSHNTFTVSLRDNAGNANTSVTSFTLNRGPDLQVRSVTPNRTVAFTNQTTKFTVKVKNKGDEAGNATINLTSDRVTPHLVNNTTTKVLKPGATQTLTFVQKFSTVGDHNITVGGVDAGLLTIKARNANFVLKRVSGVPTKVNEGTSKTVSLLVANTGSKKGQFNATIRLDGVPSGSKSITLAASNKGTLSFTVPFANAGTTAVDLHGTINKSLGSVDVRNQGYSLVSHSVSSTSITVGDTVTVRATVKNHGATADQFTLTLTRDGQRLARTTTGSIPSDGTSLVTFHVSPSNTGTSKLLLNGNSLGELTVNPRATGGGGGGGGGGFVPSGPPVVSQSSAPVNVKTGSVRLQLPHGTSVQEVEVDFGQGTKGLTTVKELGRLPSTVSRPSGGQVVSVVQIDVPRKAENSPATVRFHVSRKRLDELGLSPEDLQIEHHNHNTGKWESLPTRVVKSSGGTIVLEARTPSFSVFAVTQKSQATPTPTPTQTPSPTTSPTPTATPVPSTPTSTPTPTTPNTATQTPAKESGGFNYVPILVGILVVILAAATVVVLRQRNS
ncbi:MAG: CARDB domain-containing protein [Salinigranum sp.]